MEYTKISNLFVTFAISKSIAMELRLKEILTQRGVTLKDFAVSAGLSQSNLSNYINGNISPTLDTLKKIATHLNIDVVELFKEKDEVELYAKYNGVLYAISKDDIIDIISKKQTDEH